MGSGLQISVGLLLAGFAALVGSSDGGGGLAFAGLLAIAAAGVFISIPVFAGLNIRDGVRLLERRLSGNPSQCPNSTIQDNFQTFKKRATSVFMIMVVIFVLIQILPFGSIGIGFYFTIIGAIGTYFSFLFVKSKL